jgi:Zn-finger nucleic acid-binding protein
MMFVGSKYCPHCGAAAATRVEAEPAERHYCPRCQTAQLQAVSVGGVKLEECERCGGIWTAVDVFDQVCADRAMQEAAIALPLPPGGVQEQAVRYLKCPQCGQLMNRYRFAGRSHVVIDRCRSHGIWLDRDELRQIIEFIRAGGLTAAREAEIEQLQQERSRLEAEQRVASQQASSSLLSAHPGSDAASHLLGGIASVLFHLTI